VFGALPTPPGDHVAARVTSVEIDDTSETQTVTRERPRIALVVGVGRQQLYDFYALLRRRLQLFSSILAAVLAGVIRKPPIGGTSRFVPVRGEHHKKA
jgi:hypothetical protein